METNRQLHIERWETALSDCGALYFVGLVDRGNRLCLTVEDQDENQHEVVVEPPGPYRVADEQHLVSYWSASTKERGWTFQVSGSEWTRELDLLDVYIPKARHYAVATLDCCLEVLSEKEPRIRSL